jgi:hypothetical protein
MTHPLAMNSPYARTRSPPQQQAGTSNTPGRALARLMVAAFFLVSAFGRMQAFDRDTGVLQLSEARIHDSGGLASWYGLGWLCKNV